MACGSLVPRAGDTSVILGFSQQSASVWGLLVVPVPHGNVGRNPHLPSSLTPDCCCPSLGPTQPLPAWHPKGLKGPLEGPRCCQTRVSAPALLSAVSFRRAALLSMPAPPPASFPGPVPPPRASPAPHPPCTQSSTRAPQGCREHHPGGSTSPWPSLTLHLPPPSRTESSGLGELLGLVND